MNMQKIGAAISAARKKCGFTQEQMAELTNTPYSVLLDGNDSLAKNTNLIFRDRLFQEENMFTRMRAFALSEQLSETYQALQYMRERHLGQYRKQGRYATEKVLYINHPLLMACQAHAFLQKNNPSHPP